MTTSKYFIEKFKLIPHPEGGFFQEIYRSKDQVTPLHPRYKNETRSAATSIYYLLETHDFSSFHKVNSDETWQYCAGEATLLHIIDKNAALQTIKIGDPLKHVDAQYQFCIEEGQWFAAELEDKHSFSLVTCCVSPGFAFKDWLLADRYILLKHYPSLHEIIYRLTRVDAAKSEEDKKYQVAENSIGQTKYHNQPQDKS